MSCPLTFLPNPEVRLSLTPRSGPIEIEIEYRVDPAEGAPLLRGHAARSTKPSAEWCLWVVDRAGHRRSSTMDGALPLPNVDHYLRQRSRSTASERALHLRANEFHIGPEPVRIRRMLERPIGSVRWKDDTPDRSTGDVAPIASPGSGP